MHIPILAVVKVRLARVVKACIEIQDRKSLGPVARGFLVAPLVPALAIMLLITFGNGWGSWRWAEWWLFPAGVFAFYSFAAIPTLALALPAFVIFQHLGWVSLRTTLLSGFALGATVYAALNSASPWSMEKLQWTCIYGAVGLVSAAAFWWGWTRSRGAQNRGAPAAGKPA